MHIADADQGMKDPVQHFSLKMDLIDHIWKEDGHIES